jgi:hypothetical protein
MKSFPDPFKSAGIFIVVLLLSTLGLIGCSNGGASSAALDEYGELAVSLTDAAGDFSSYTVDVLSLNLTKANGAEVAALPLTTRIDFAQYTEMTEFLTAATVPSGTYVAATLTLDYRNADIWVEDENGDNIRISDIVDENGDPVTTLEVTVQLEDINKLTIAPGIPAHLMLDFDLQASNQVDFNDPAAPVLTVDPFLVADVNRVHPHKIHRVRGLLDEVNPGESSFSVILRPFYCVLDDDHRSYGIRSVITDDDTVFNIDGAAYEGPDGLAALAGLDRLTPVVALGSLKFNPLQFEAWEVYAGASVPGAGLDVISGWVTRRSVDALTVKGASLIRSGRTAVFNDEVTVQISDTTVVSRQISSGIYTKDDISIGQHITAFGNLINADPGNLEMDATGGFVRMMLTTVRGTVVSIDQGDPSGQLTVDLQSIGKFRVGAFDFTGTGTTPEYDADPANYQIFTGTMDLSAIAADTPVKLKGFAGPFGMAPPDFSAYTVIDVTDLKAFIRIDWMPATGTPFTGISAGGLMVNLEGTGRLHYLVRGSIVTDLNDLSKAPVIAPDGDGKGLYILKYGDVTEIHTVFNGFVLRMEELLGKGYLARKTNAKGLFDDSSCILTADVIEVHLARARNFF